MAAQNYPLPPGWQMRPARPEDADELFTLVDASIACEHGESDLTREDFFTPWQREGFRLAQDSLVLQAGDGSLAAYVDVLVDHEEVYVSHLMSVLPAWRELNLEHFLLAWAEGQAARPGATARRVRMISTHAGRERLLEGQGYRPIRWDYSMEIVFHEPPRPGRFPAGYRLRPFVPGQDERAMHRLVQDAFADLEHRTEQSFEAWAQIMLRRDDFDPALVLLAAYGGELAGTAFCFDYPGEGWVRQLAVHREHRGRGLGSALLQQAFYIMAQRGKPKLGLVVDSNNATGALRLYQQAGMQMVETFIHYGKQPGAAG